jgi:hypothetical protein
MQRRLADLGGMAPRPDARMAAPARRFDAYHQGESPKWGEVGPAAPAEGVE